MERVSKREYSVDFLKVIATLFLVFCHYQQNYTGQYTVIHYYQGKLSDYVVELFFIISGYFALHMTKEISKNGGVSFSGFYWKRIKRLLPLLAITAVVDQAVRLGFELLLGEPYGDGLSLWGTVLSATGLQSGGAFLPQGINNPTWYVSVLLICYAVLYLLTWLSDKLGIAKQWLYVGMILLGASALTYSFNLPFLNFYSARGYTAFFTGVCLEMLFARYPIYERKSWGICGVLFLALFWLLSKFYYSAVEADMRFLTIFLLWPCVMLVFKTPVMSRLLSQRFWGVLGAISFNAYVWHADLIKIINTYCRWSGQNFFRNRPAMLMFGVAAFLVGAVSYRFLEKPIAAYLDRKVSAERKLLPV